MSVTETKEALGTWSVALASDTPREILDQVKPFGHLAIVPGRVDVRTTGDNLLRAARYVGVFRTRADKDDDTCTLSGAGMAFWLGDEDDKGAVWITPAAFAAATFANTIRGLLPTSGAVTEGVIHAVSGSYTGTHQYESPRTSIQYVCDTFSTTTFPVSWRVNGDGTLDAGLDSDLFVTSPTAIIVRQGDAGRDMFLAGLNGQMTTTTDVSDYTTEVVLLAEGDGASTVTAVADLVTPYRDIHGNLVVLRRIVSEFETDSTNAMARAQLQLNRFTNPAVAVDLSSDEYDIKGDFGVGDTVWVFDPDIGLSDANNQVTFRGQVLNPIAITVAELTWPVEDGWTVAFRTQAGVWLDLTDYYVPEGGSSTIKVGAFSRAINDSATQPIGSRPIGDGSIPAVPVFGAATTSSYQSDATGSGDTKAQIQLTWTQPINTDGSTVLDGDHYEIRYRATASTILTSWSTAAIAWGQTAFLITDLTPGTNYDFQIQAVDGAVPPNLSGWSATKTVLSSVDTVAPSTPAPPTVAASLIAVQVTHTLGKSSGGTYNLEVDLDHLEVHAGALATFTPDATTRLGKLVADVGNLRAGIPAVATFNVSSTAAVWIKVIAVDTSGNRSGASTGASSTALLIDNAHISDLTVSKVSAGTIGATWIQGGTITTAASGARVELAASGLNAYNSAGTKTVEIKGSDGSATITGTIRTDFATSANPYLLLQNSGDRTTIYLYNAAHDNYAFINSPQDSNNKPTLGLNSGAFIMSGNNSRHVVWLANTSGIFLRTNNDDTGHIHGGQVYLTAGGSELAHYATNGDQTGGRLAVDGNGFILYANTTGTQNGGGIYADGSSLRLSSSNSGTTSSEIDLFDDQSIWFTGKFTTSNPIGGLAALFTDTWATGFAASYTANFGATMDTTLWPVISIARSGGPFYAWITDIQATYFTMNSNVTSGSLRFDYWCFRRA